MTARFPNGLLRNLHMCDGAPEQEDKSRSEDGTDGRGLDTWSRLGAEQKVTIYLGPKADRGQLQA